MSIFALHTLIIHECCPGNIIKSTYCSTDISNVIILVQNVVFRNCETTIIITSILRALWVILFITTRELMTQRLENGLQSGSKLAVSNKDSIVEMQCWKLKCNCHQSMLEAPGFALIQLY